MKREKLFALLLSGVLAVSLTACGDESGPKPIDDSNTSAPQAETAAPNQTAAPEAQAPADTEAPETTEEPEESGVTIQPDQVLVERDGITITAKEMVEDSIWGPGVKLLLENDTDQTLSIGCNTLVVNDYMLTDLFATTLAAGKKANEVLYLSRVELEEAGIETIAEIAASFHVYNDETYDKLFDTDEVTIQTSAYGTVEQAPMDDGKELYNEGGIRIVGRYVDEDGILGAGVQLFLENQSGEDVTIQCDDMSVNGFMVTPFFSSDVNDGRMAMRDITILTSDLETNDIEQVEEVELVFQILNPHNFHTIAETGPVSFSVSQ